MTVALNVVVNGTDHAVQADPRRTLADYLREDLRLTGTHVGCEQGYCGACTVMVDGRSARACLTLLTQLDGAEVLTVEGLSDGPELDLVQQALCDTHAFQCGFCAPGFVISISELVRDGEAQTEAEVRKALSGNLCRCTGYERIVDAAMLALERSR